MYGYISAYINDPWTTIICRLGHYPNNKDNAEGFYIDNVYRLFDKVTGTPIVWMKDGETLEQLKKSPFIKNLSISDSTQSKEDFSFNSYQTRTRLPDKISYRKLLSSYLSNTEVYPLEICEEIAGVLKESFNLEAVTLGVSNSKQWTTLSKRLIHQLHSEIFSLVEAIWNLSVEDEHLQRTLNAFDKISSITFDQSSEKEIDFFNHGDPELHLLLTFFSLLGDGYRGITNNILRELSTRS